LDSPNCFRCCIPPLMPALDQLNFMILQTHAIDPLQGLCMYVLVAITHNDNVTPPPPPSFTCWGSCWLVVSLQPCDVHERRYMEKWRHGFNR
jgi:hypothetical protein